MPHVALRRIAVTNFRGVKSRQVLDFTGTPPGLYFIRGVNVEGPRLGSNGAGKSTLLAEAPIWALTGRTSRSQRPGSDVENRQAGGTTSVELELVVDGDAHVVERTRNPNNLVLDGSKVEQGEIDALLPLTDEALRKSILIDQFGEMFLDLRREAKSQIFTDTLALDRWMRAADRAGIYADAAARDLQAVLSRRTSNQSVLAEVRDQYESARRGEEQFEADLDGKVAEARKRETSARKETETARRALDDARAASAKLGGGDRVTELNDCKTQLRRLQRAAAEAVGQVTSSGLELARLDAQLVKYNEAALLCPECGQPVGIQHIREKRADLATRIADQRQLRVRYEEGVEAVQAEVSGTERKIAKLEALLTKQTAAIGEVSVAAEKSIAADRALHRVRDELEELRTRTNPFTGQCDKLEARIKQLRQDAKALKLEEEDASRRAAIYQFWQKGFREIRLQQLDDALLELEIATNRHAETLGLEDWRIEFATERETRKGTVSHGFTVSLYPPGETEPVSWESYCGGEVQRWQLAATFGLAEVLLARAGVSTDFEILDEPTSHLSPEGIEELLTCLGDRARELRRRIFLIDHNSLDRGSFDGVIVIAKTKERGTYVEDGGGVIPTVSKSKRERVTL